MTPMATRTGGASQPRSSEYLQEEDRGEDERDARQPPRTTSRRRAVPSRTPSSERRLEPDVRSRQMSRGGGGSIGGAIGGAGEGGFSARGGSGGIVGGDGGEGTTTGGGGAGLSGAGGAGVTIGGATGLGAAGGATTSAACAGAGPAATCRVNCVMRCSRRSIVRRWFSRAFWSSSSRKRSALCRTRLTIGRMNGSDATISARKITASGLQTY